MRILVAEDDPTLQHGLIFALTEMGHQVVAASDGAHADTLLGNEYFDLVVLDLGLPKLDGTIVLERLRRRRQSIPVLILSARDRTEDRVRGLNLGADDYLTKPFELSEFEARVRALLRRGQGVAVNIGLLEWFWDRREVLLNGVALTLSKHELTMLEALVQARGHIVAKSALAHLLGDDVDVAGDNMVEVYIHRLRKKLLNGDVGIRTIRGLGYLLQATNKEK